MPTRFVSGGFRYCSLVSPPPSPHQNWSTVRAPWWRRFVPRRLLLWVVVLLLTAVVAGFVAVRQHLAGNEPEFPELAQGREEPGDIPGVQTFEIESREHTDEPVDYPQDPPVGGPHTTEWLNCGIYPEEDDVVVENAVHAMEHGTVWITHRPDLAPDDLDLLRSYYQPGAYVVISPMDGLGAPIVLSAWGKQLGLASPADGRVEEFLRRYERGPQTPGHGGPCTGGVGDPVIDPSGL